MNDPNYEILRLSVLDLCDAVEALGQRLDKNTDAVNNAPKDFAAIVVANTKAVQQLAKAIEDKDRDYEARFARLEAAAGKRA